MTLLEFWNAQSDTVKGAVLGATVAMVGVIINGFATAWNTSRQLAHDVKQRGEERALVLRRDIYLGVAQHLQARLRTISNLSDLTLEHREVFKDERDSAHYVAKLHLMGKPLLLEAVTTAGETINTAMVRVRIERQRLQQIEGTKTRLLQQITAHRKSAADAIAYFKSKGLESPVQADESSRIEQIIKAEFAKADELSEKHDALLEEYRHGVAALWIQVGEEQKALYPLLIPVIAAARAELGETIEMSVYERILRDVRGVDPDSLRALNGIQSSVPKD